MRLIFTTADAVRRGMTPDQLRWGEHKGRWRRIERGVYGSGPEEPTPLDRALAAVVVTGGVASGNLAGTLYGLDGVELNGPALTLSRRQNGRRSGARRRELDPARVTSMADIRCTTGLQTLLDLAGTLDDARWEQALESALRKRLVSIGEIGAAVGGTVGAARIRRVLRHRPAGACPTESLLETLMVQLARGVSLLAPPVRQYRVVDAAGGFVARVDLAWPELGLFVELDGQHHAGQPVHDARRETAVVAATGWLCGRFTWTEVVRVPRSTTARLGALAERARSRPLVDPGRPEITMPLE